MRVGRKPAVVRRVANVPVPQTRLAIPQHAERLHQRAIHRHSVGFIRSFFRVLSLVRLNTEDTETRVRMIKIRVLKGPKKRAVWLCESLKIKYLFKKTDDEC